MLLFCLVMVVTGLAGIGFGSAGMANAANKKAYFHEQDGYRLNDNHKNNGCSSCHVKTQRRGKKKDCTSCHQPGHDLPGNLGCRECHSLESFADIKPYRHILNDSFRLGVHKITPCRKCHPQGRFKGNPRECLHCHQERQQDAPHGMKLGGDCAECHTAWGWQPVRHQHDDFNLKAGHRNLNCLDCHPEYEFRQVVSYCYTCHREEFHGSGGGLDHARANLPYDCRLCHGHNMNDFSPPLAYDNHPENDLIKRGNHRQAGCLECHKRGVFRGLGTLCYNCHEDDYAKAIPNHISGGFPHDCELCHKSNNSLWEGAGRDHLWPLRGTHQTLACSECHEDGVFNGKDTKCFSCHSSDYQGSRNPNHQEAGYPTDCSQCHQDTHTSFNQATFNHPLALIGGHADLSCRECHSENNNYSVFICTDCHAHQRQDMNRLHRDRGVSGYNYNSLSCYSCHPQGLA